MNRIFFLLLTFLPVLLQGAIGPRGFDDFKGRVFVETGTDKGLGVKKALKAKFEVIHSLENDPLKYNKCAKGYRINKKVTIHKKDSSKELKDVISSIDEPITFWLDSRTKGVGASLLDELQQIQDHKVNTHTILINDIHHCRVDSATVIAKLQEINPDYSVKFINGNQVLVAEDPHQSAFTKIYKDKVWGQNSEGEGFSGGGSLKQNCREYVLLLEKFIKERGINSVVDAGCGDWEFSCDIDWNGADYIGYDVVHSVIEKDQERYGSDSTHFVHANFLNEDLPEADLLLCKHVLQHIRNEDIIKFLPQLKKFKYCIITNEVYPNTLSSDNVDTEVGGGHKIDLSKEPFNIKGTKLTTYFINKAAHQVFLIENE